MESGYGTQPETGQGRGLKLAFDFARVWNGCHPEEAESHAKRATPNEGTCATRWQRTDRCNSPAPRDL